MKPIKDQIAREIGALVLWLIILVPLGIFVGWVWSFWFLFGYTLMRLSALWGVFK